MLQSELLMYPNVILRSLSFVALLVVVGCSSLLTGCIQKSPETLLTEARDYAARDDYRTAAIQLRTLLKHDPDNAEGVLMLANVALAGNNPALAERNFRRAASLGVDPARTWDGHLQALLELGRYQDALDATQTADGTRTFASAGDNARQFLLIARAQIGLQRLDAAEAALRQSLAVQPTAAAHVELARVLGATNRQSEADTELAAALKLEPDDPEALLMEGLRVLAGGDRKRAEPLLDQALERGRAEKQTAVQAMALGTLAELDLAARNFDAAGKRADELAGVVGNQPDVRYLRARVALEQKDLERAKAELQEILATSKNYTPAQRLLGAIYTLENQFDLAEMYLRPVLAANPDDLFARRLLATVHLARNRPAEALPLLDNVTAPDAESRESLLAMQGQASLQLGDVARAISIFQEGSRAYPKNPLFELGLGLTLLAEGRTDDAADLLRQARGAEADATRATFLTIIAMQKGRTDEALASARSVVQKFPDQAWSYNLLGSVLMATGQFAEAHTAIDKAVDLDPKDSAALANLARVEELMGNPAASAAAWQRILDKDPTNADAAFWLARLQLDQGDVPKALKILEPFQKNSSRARLLVGSILLDRGATEDVRKLASQVTRDEPDNAEGWNLLGLADMVSGATRDAIVKFNKAVELRPTGVLYRVNLARAYLIDGDDKAATEALAAARKLNPDLLQLRSLEFLREMRRDRIPEARRILDGIKADKLGDETLYDAMDAELLLAENKPAEAADLYQAAYLKRPNLDLAVKAWSARKQATGTGDATALVDWLKRNPDDPRAARALGDAYLGDNKTAEAEASYEKVLKLIPDDLQTLNNLAWLAQERGDKRALKLGDRAVKLAPDSAPVLDTAGWAHLQLGDPQQGMSLIRRAADREPTDPDIQYHLAVALLKTGQPAEGKRVLTALLNKSQAFASRAAAEQMLSAM
ncbi:MAG: PEP-CTERM system TPR-repeat protein PrsT [Gammaproteobacteria bacterium]